MSSSESSGTPAEGSATPPAPAAEFPSFGSTRGSGLARGKRPAASAAASAAPSAAAYTPTAIEVVHAPREYTNPFAPAEPTPASAPADTLDRAIETPKSETSIPPAAVGSPAPVTTDSVPEIKVMAPVSSAETEPAQLNILPPAEQKSAPAQTWESDGFAPARESRRERPRREESAEEEVDIASIPPQFLYVRPGVKFVPTPRNWGGAPRERTPRSSEGAPRREETPRVIESNPTPTVTEKSGGGFIGWLKSLLAGEPTASTAAEPVAAGRSEERREGGHRRHRGGRSGGRGEGSGSNGGGHRRRGGRGRGPRPGGDAGPAAT